MDGRLAGVVLLAAVALAGCAGGSPRPAPATVTARVTAQAPVWLDLPQMT